jgi:hypothetical protein
MQHDLQDIERMPGHPSPLKAVRLHCLSCCNGSANEVRLCPSRACPLWPFRHGHRPVAEDRAAVAGRQVYPLERDLTDTTTALRAIRLRCVDCAGNRDAEARSCKFGPDNAAHCSLHPFRIGRNPNIARSDEWKQAAAERLALARAAALPKLPVETPDRSSERATEGDRAGETVSEKIPHAL